MKDTGSIAVEGAMFDGRYKLLRPLSSDGGTADVWLALDTNTIDEVYDEASDATTSSEATGIKVAIKIYRPKNALDLGEQRFREEFKIVFNCHHTNLVQPINFSIYEGIPYLVLPFCRNGSSEQMLGRMHDSDELWRYISDVSAGLAYLHAFNPTIVHQDIKPANVLIDDGGTYAITDFGISSHRGLSRDACGYDTLSGTMAYMAPERFGDAYEATPESDIWSFGATLYELITGSVPFGEEGGIAQVENSVHYPPISQPVSTDIKELIYDCLAIDASKRPSAAAIHRAAQLRRYPANKYRKLQIAVGGGVIAILALLAILLWPKPAEQVVPPVVATDEEMYDKAVALMAHDDLDSLTLGLAILDSIGGRGYVPALYEQAFTYGWYSDSASVARKRLLGIALCSTNPQKDADAFLPKSYQVNNKAIGLFARIEELSDPRYPDINANALYRLACYYVNPNELFKKDEERAKALLTQAREWVDRCERQDAVLLKRIDAGLKQLKQQD